ncbi:MAG: C39 family peptidase, partial [Geovibrio sp.]|nr:C39 family peptidase [Geovibrio sp.]
MTRDMNISILPQPDDTSCGPTCLHAVYSYYGEDLRLEDLRKEIAELETGGTLAVVLGLHALRRGYRVTIYSYNLVVFDPTWFRLPPEGIINKLKKQMEVKTDPKLRYTSKKYIEFLTLGGELKFADLSPALIRKYLDRQTPIITALS